MNDREKLIKQINEMLEDMSDDTLEMELDRLKLHHEVSAILTLSITNEGFIDEMLIDEAEGQDIMSAFDLNEEMRMFIDSMEKDLWDTKVSVVVNIEVETDTTEGIQEYTDWLTVVDFYILDRNLSKYYDSEDDCLTNYTNGLEFIE